MIDALLFGIEAGQKGPEAAVGVAEETAREPEAAEQAVVNGCARHKLDRARKPDDPALVRRALVVSNGKLTGCALAYQSRYSPSNHHAAP